MTLCHETEVEHRAHNPKVVGSNPTPATKNPQVNDLGVRCLVWAQSVVPNGCQTSESRIGFVSPSSLANALFRSS